MLFLIVVFSLVYRVLLVLGSGFPPGADIGLHNSIIHSITQGGNTNFLYNFYQMGGGSSNTFPGYHIFVSCIIYFTGLPDYLAQAFAAILFSVLLVPVAFLITRRFLNETIALIVALLVGVSYYDIYMLLWSGYPNIITLMLIPLTFYLLLEKSRFSPAIRLPAASLLSAAIFLTHSLSTVMFMVIIFVSVLIALSFPRSLGISRKEALEWLGPPCIGGLAVSPFLIQAAPIYLNLNSAVYTGGLPAIQKLLLPLRLLPLNIIESFFVCFLLLFIFFRLMNVKIIQFQTLLFAVWIIIPIVLTQSYFAGFYTDYERFLYFANLPDFIVIGTGIFLGTRYLAKGTNWLLSATRSPIQKRFGESMTLKKIRFQLSSKTLLAIFAVVLIVFAFFEFPVFFMMPSAGFRIQEQQQVMNQPGYDAIQWIKNNTPASSVFVADALYGWWLGGFAQRPTVSAVEPVFITNSREFEPALLATRLLETDFLVDNGLIQIIDDGGYAADCNPEFLAKLSDSYYPFPFIDFNNSQTSITFSNDEELNSVKLSELSVKDMNLENSSNLATISVTLGNEFLNFTQEATVYQGVRFVNITDYLSTDNPAIRLVNMILGVQTTGQIIEGNGTCLDLEDPYMNVAGQMIFKASEPTVTQVSDGPIQMLFNLNSQNEAQLNFYVSVFEYPQLHESSEAQAGLYESFINNLNSYADKVAEFPLDVFDYLQAISTLNASYIAIRDFSQLARFAKDPTFSLVFINQEVAIFKIRGLNSQ